MKVYFWEGHCTAVSEPPGLAVFLSHTHTKKRHQVSKSTLIPILDLRTSQPEPVVDLGENFGTLALVYRAHTHMVNWDTCAFSATIKSTLQCIGKTMFFQGWEQLANQHLQQVWHFYLQA